MLVGWGALGGLLLLVVGEHREAVSACGWGSMGRSVSACGSGCSGRLGHKTLKGVIPSSPEGGPGPRPLPCSAFALSEG